MAYSSKKVRVKIDDGTEEGAYAMLTKATVTHGRVLLLNGERHSRPVTDKFSEVFQGFTMETEFGYRHNGYTSDPVLAAQVTSLRHNDIVNVEGVQKRSGAIRVTKLEVVKKAAVASPTTAPAA